MAVGLAVLMSGVMAWRKVRAADGLLLEWLSGRRLRLHRGSIIEEARVARASVDLGVCLVLVWESAERTARSGHARCVLTRGGVGGDAWRGLRARLRWDVASDSSAEGGRAT